ncbi:MAG: tetratricopeptide repeat protein [Chitinophagaceae bacterium]
MKKAQWITIGAAIILTAVLFLFGRVVPQKKAVTTSAEQHGPGDGHNHEEAFSIDSILIIAKTKLSPDQAIRINTLENSISRGDVKDQQIHVYHQLARFWGDSARVFEPYAWYQAEAARLENSKKNLTFAARLFLDNLQNDEIVPRKQWKAMQAKDLFERSLKINPDNDSAKVGLGACYLFGGISSSPMEGIAKIREVVEKDSANLYAQLTLAKGSLLSGQYDKAISRLLTVARLQPDNAEAILLLADAYESTGDKANAINWYQKCLSLMTQQPEIKVAIEKRIEDLKK